MNKTSEGKMEINFSFEKREAITVAGLLSLRFLIGFFFFITFNDIFRLMGAQ